MQFKVVVKTLFCLLFISGNCFAFDRENLLAHYPFAGDARDYSGNNRHGLVVGASLTSDREGNPNSAYFFNGNDVIRASSFNGFDWGDQFTVSAWYKRTGLFDKYMGIVNNGYFDRGSFEIRMGRENGGTNIFGRINSEGGGTGAMGFNAVTAANNEWHHTVLTYDGTTASYYIDNQLVSSTTAASGDMLVKFNILAIGQGGNGGGRGVTGEYFFGAIDDVRVYQRAFTAADVAALYQEEAETGFILNAGTDQVIMAGETVTLDATSSYDSEGNPISYSWELLRSPGNVSVSLSDALTPVSTFTAIQPGFYSFRVTGDNGEITLTDTVDVHIIPSVNTSELIAYLPIATNANDYSGNNHNGAVSGATLTTDRDGNPNSAYFFDGRDRININSLRNFEFGNQFTASLWFRRTGQTDRYQGLINNGYNTFGSFEIRMGRESNGRVIFTRLRTDNGATNGIGFNDVFPAVGQWHHAVVTYDGNASNFYINGEFVEQSTGAKGDLLVRNNPVTIGHAGVGASNTEFFFGAIDDIRIFNRALAPEEVEQLFLGETASSDTDGDGIEDAADNCPTNNNSDQSDLDNDGIGDACDTDLDGDQVDNSADNCPAIANQDQSDVDADGVGDVCDTDIDGDTIENTADNCPVDNNQDQADMDSDGLGDVCDPDIDGDLIDNTIDNCPVNTNPDQQDLDFDGLGDACDSDLDGDSIANDLDNCPIINNPDQLDFDSDGLGDLCDDDIDDDSWLNNLDCEPFNADINPGEIEIINNGVDENCDASDDNADQISNSIVNIINSIDPADLKGKNWAKTFNNKLNEVVSLVESAAQSTSTAVRTAQLSTAIDKLDNDIIAKTDGCAISGSADNNDKILLCSDQANVYPALIQFRDTIANLLAN